MCHSIQVTYLQEVRITWLKYGITKHKRQFHTISKALLVILIQSHQSFSIQKTMGKSLVLEREMEFSSGTSMVILMEITKLLNLLAKTSRVSLQLKIVNLVCLRKLERSTKQRKCLEIRLLKQLSLFPNSNQLSK